MQGPGYPSDRRKTRPTAAQKVLVYGLANSDRMLHTTESLMEATGLSKRSVKSAQAELQRWRVLDKKVQMTRSGKVSSWMFIHTPMSASGDLSEWVTDDQRAKVQDDLGKVQRTGAASEVAKVQEKSVAPCHDRCTMASTSGNRRFARGSEGVRQSIGVRVQEKEEKDQVRTESGKDSHARTREARPAKQPHPKALADRWQLAYDPSIPVRHEIDSIFDIFTKLLAEEGFEQPRYDDKIRANLQGWLLELDERWAVENAVIHLFFSWPNGSRVCNDPANPVLFERDMEATLRGGGRLRQIEERHRPAMELMSQLHDEKVAPRRSVPEESGAEYLRLVPKRAGKTNPVGGGLDGERQERLRTLVEKNAWIAARFDAKHPRPRAS